MSVKPILFNTEMVQAILDGRKTATRRAVKPQFALDADGKKHAFGDIDGNIFIWADKPNIKTVIHPPYSPGNILYVRETWRILEVGNPPPHCVVEYKAGGMEKFDNIIALPTVKGEWHPSIHMPKEAARLFLRITDVRVERLQDMTGHDVLAEGVDNGSSNPTMGARWENMQRMAFEGLWDSTVKKADMPRYGWNANPWVWVIEFEQIGKEVALEEARDT